MPDKVLVVTFPDDVIIDAKRILLFDPTAEQTQLISSCLSASEFGCDIVFYIWRFGDDIDWLLDKILKYDLAILNADTEEQGLLGYLFAKPNSYYIGNIRSLSKLKKSEVLGTDHLNSILKERLTYCE
jgi:hypothetical protein